MQALVLFGGVLLCGATDSAADGEKRPPAKTPQEAAEQIAKAAKAGDRMGITAYLADRSANLLRQTVAMFESEVRFEKALDDKFGKAGSRAVGSIDDFLKMYYLVKFIEATTAGDKTVVELERSVSAPNGKKDIARIKCYAVKGEHGWGIDYPVVMVRPGSIVKSPDVDGNLRYTQDFTDSETWEKQLKLQEKVLSGRSDLLNRLTDDTRESKFRSREEAKRKQREEEMRPEGPRKE